MLLLAVAACGGPQRPGDGQPLELVVEQLDGRPLAVSSLRGRVAVIHVFTIGSMAAQADVDQLREVHARHPDEVAVLGVALEPQGALLVEPWMRALDVTYPVALGGDEIIGGHTALGAVRQIPVTLVLDRDGMVVFRADRQLRPAELARAVQSALGG